MILNKTYSKEEYLDIKKKIQNQLREDNLLGQFFPPAVAPFAYNESLIQDFYPLRREEALSHFP